MKAMLKTHVEVILKMDKKEALWLKSVMQNPIHVDQDIVESMKDADMRSKLFDVLSDFDDIEFQEDN